MASIMEPLWLVVEQGAREGVTIPIEGQVLVGRDPSCTLALPDRGVSRRHVMLAASPEGVLCLDLESRNGTRVNGERVRRATLRPGDRVRLGEALLLVSLAADSRPPARASGGEAPGISGSGEDGGPRERSGGSAGAAPAGEIRLRGEKVLAFSPWRNHARHSFLTADLSQAGPLPRLLAILALTTVAVLLGWGAYRLVVDLP